ncbi:MAG: T9SS type A sorting domain-containing protein [Bacteroidia bacterium]|nr:T9SS type A sorting domain-containing protein [Bacteroidia bacterium]
MFNKFLRPWINRRSHSSAANPPRKFFVAALAMLFAGFSANAQVTPIAPNLQQIMDDKSAPSVNTTLGSGTPVNPDPMRSTLVPGSPLHQKYWQNQRYLNAQSRAKSGGNGGTYAERERGMGHNDTQRRAERLNLGTGFGKNREIAVSGVLAPPPTFPINPMSASEDDGSIPLANLTGINGSNQGVSYNETIGDGPNAGVADFDMYRVDATAGTTIEVDINTADPFGDLDPTVAIFFEDGTLVAFNDDGPEFSFDSFLRYEAEADGSYYISVGGYLGFYPADPFDSGSGGVIGLIGSEGDYEAIIRTFELDVDFYSFYLKRGDVLGAAVQTDAFGTLLEVYGPREFEKGVIGFGSFAVPESPLPINGQTVLDYIAEEGGYYAVAVSNNEGPYTLTLGVSRPGFEENKRRVQVVWLDYNGGLVDVGQIFEFPPGAIVANHSPFRDFLPAWGLPDAPGDIRRITRKITRETRDNLYTELNNSRVNRNLGVVVLGNDGTGNPDALEPLMAAGTFTILGLQFDVSDVEISGTIAESGVGTIGIAQSIDPGNFASQEKALLLLDILSAPASGGNANGTFSLNDVVLAPGVTKENMVSTVIANVVSHEAGHYLGNFHTDGFTDVQTIMDQGPGGLFNLAGIGPSGVFGGPDQTDVEFATDMYAASEGFLGDENTTINTAYALSYFPFGRYYADDMPNPIAEQLGLSNRLKEDLLNQSVPNSLLRNGVATIKFEAASDTEAIIDIYDLSGNKVGRLFEGDVKSGESNVVTLHAGDFNLKPGVYLYKLETANGSKHRKIVVKE